MGIFDQIKSAFSSGDDVKETPAVRNAKDDPKPAAEAARHYTVQSGDTLYKIAEELYGSGDEYQKIFEANRETLDSPDRIKPGQKLNIP